MLLSLPYIVASNAFIAVEFNQWYICYSCILFSLCVLSVQFLLLSVRAHHSIASYTMQQFLDAMHKIYIIINKSLHAHAQSCKSSPEPEANHSSLGIESALQGHRTLSLAQAHQANFLDIDL